LSHGWSYILYALLAVGAAGVYGVLPNPARRSRRPGAILLLAALAGLIVFGIRSAAWGGANDVYFYVFGGVALYGAVRVVTHARPVYSALHFVLVVLSVAGVLVLVDAEFLAAALVIIYVGAILVTYIFVIMLAQQGGVAPYDSTARDPVAAVLVGFVLVVCVGTLLAEPPGIATAGSSAASVGVIPSAMTDPRWTGEPSASESGAPVAAADAAPGNVREVGRLLLARYAVAVEVAGALLLVAMVGAIWVARRPMPGRVPAAPGVEKSPGQIGREVPPF
jgi:NADH-quinone oxidoreductase subunit J